MGFDVFSYFVRHSYEDVLVRSADIQIHYRALFLFKNSKFHCMYTRFMSFYQRRTHVHKKIVYCKRPNYIKNVIFHRMAQHYDVVYYCSDSDGSKSYDFIQGLVVSAAIAAEFRRVRSMLGKEYVSVHVRNTDYSCNVHLILGKHLDVLKNNVVYVASDDHATRLLFLESLPQVVTSYTHVNKKKEPIHYYHNYISGSDIEQLFVHSFVDLLLLARGKTFVESVGTYTRLASKLHANRETVASVLGDTCTLDVDDSARADSARADSARADSARADSARADSARADGARLCSGYGIIVCTNIRMDDTSSSTDSDASIKMYFYK